MAVVKEDKGDAGADTGTSYTLSLDSVFRGSFEPAADKDWLKVELTEGTIYDFTLSGVAGEVAELALFDSEGNYCHLRRRRSHRRKAHLQSECYRDLLYPGRQ